MAIAKTLPGESKKEVNSTSARVLSVSLKLMNDELWVKNKKWGLIETTERALEDAKLQGRVELAGTMVEKAKIERDREVEKLYEEAAKSILGILIEKQTDSGKLIRALLNSSSKGFYEEAPGPVILTALEDLCGMGLMTKKIEALGPGKFTLTRIGYKVVGLLRRIIRLRE